MTVRSAATAVAKADQPKTTVEGTIAHLIERQKDQLARALPRLMDPDRFARVLITECKANPGLLRAEPTSLMAAVMKAAALGIEPGPLGHVYLVPFKNGKTGKTEVQFILGYKGMIELARRSGQVQSIYGDVVYAGDEFDYVLGLNRDLTHRRSPTSNREAITHAYAVARYVDGGFDFVVLDRVEIDARRMRSRAKDSGPWVTDFAAMARKTAVRALATWLPMTVEGAVAVQSDERTYSLDDLGDVIDVEEPAVELAPVPDPPADPETGEVIDTTAEPAA